MKIKVFLIILISGLCAYIGATEYENVLYAQSTSNVTISASDLNQAGYTGVTNQLPTGLDYQPASYFWVNGVADHSNSSNLLMVSQYHQNTLYTEGLFGYGTNRHSFLIPGGVGQEGTLSNDARIVLNFSKGNYYIVIIGPDMKKVEALALIIANKI